MSGRGVGNDEILRLWNAGMSGPEIVAVLGGALSRAAVMGVVHRARLKAPHAVRSPGPGARVSGETVAVRAVIPAACADHLAQMAAEGGWPDVESMAASMLAGIAHEDRRAHE